jgi:hypothetical protein
MDPLRPFADLVRSLWGNRSTPTPRTDSTAPSRASSEQQSRAAIDPTDELRTRLRARLTQAGLSDPGRAREVFVEVVLTWELGDRALTDPTFATVVKAVADRINQRPQLSGRLQELLVTLTQA